MKHTPDGSIAGKDSVTIGGCMNLQVSGHESEESSPVKRRLVPTPNKVSNYSAWVKAETSPLVYHLTHDNCSPILSHGWDILLHPLPVETF